MSSSLDTPSRSPRAHAKRPRSASPESAPRSPEAYDLALDSLVRASSAGPSRGPSAGPSRGPSPARSGAASARRPRARGKTPPGSGVGSSSPAASKAARLGHPPPAAQPPREAVQPGACGELVRLTQVDDATGEAVFLLRASRGKLIPISGSVELQVLRGAVSVLAHTLTPASRPMPLYSTPYSPFQLTLSVVDRPGRGPGAEHLSPAVEAALMENTPLANGTGTGAAHAVVRLRPVRGERDLFRAVAPFFATLPIPYTRGGGDDGKALVEGCALGDGESRHSTFSLWEEWGDVLSSLSCWQRAHGRLPVRVVAVGDGGTGKSMLARCLANHLLETNAAVVFVETDVGQPELTPPGLVAAFELRSPLLGPPLSHNRAVPVVSRFYGDITPREHASSYLAAVSFVIGAARAHAAARGFPLVCNSDGWVSGTGAELLQHIVGQLEPSHAFATGFKPAVGGDVEVGAALRRGEKLQAHNLRKGCELNTQGVRKGALRLFPDSIQCVLEKFPADQRAVLFSPHASKLSAFSPGLLRDMGLISYFAGALDQGVTRCVSLEDVNVSFLGEGIPSPRILAALNGSVVALGVSGGDVGPASNWNVRGLGLVRGVDVNLLTLHICSPLDDEVLEACDAIIMSGGLQAPAALYFGMAGRMGEEDVGVEDSAPYIVRGVLGNADAMRSRSTLQRR